MIFSLRIFLEKNPGEENVVFSEVFCGLWVFHGG